MWYQLFKNSVSPSGHLLPREHLALQRRVPGILHLSPLPHGEQRLLDLVLSDAGIQLWRKGSPCCSWPAARHANHFRASGPEYTVVPAPTRTLLPSASKPALRNNAGIIVPIGSTSGAPLLNTRLRLRTHSPSRSRLRG